MSGKYGSWFYFLELSFLVSVRRLWLWFYLVYNSNRLFLKFHRSILRSSIFKRILLLIFRLFSIFNIFSWPTFTSGPFYVIVSKNLNDILELSSDFYSLLYALELLFFLP